MGCRFESDRADHNLLIINFSKVRNKDGSIKVKFQNYLLYQWLQKRSGKRNRTNGENYRHPMPYGSAIDYDFKCESQCI